MKRVITILILILLAKISLAQYNWVKIYDSPFYGIKNFYSEKINLSNQKVLYLMLGLNYENPNESGRMYRLNKTNGNWVIPANGFLNPYWCFGAVPPNPPSYHCNYVTQFKVSPIDTQFILKNSDIFCGGYEGGNSFFVTYNSGIDTSFISMFSQSLAGQICTGFDIDPVNDSIIYVLYPHDPIPYPARVFKSTNRGLNWFITDSVHIYATQYSFAKINPLLPNYMIVSGTDMYMSTNSGYNFFQLNVPLLKSVYFDMTGLYVYGLGVGDSCLYKSTNNGLNWSLLNKFSKRPAAFEISPDNHDILYAGALDGLYKSTNKGLNWSMLNNSFYPSKSVIGISKDPGTGETLYVSTTDAVYKVWGQYIQNVDTNALSYFPLAVGNVWVYRIDLSGTYCMRTDIRRIKVIDTIILNSKKYFLCKDTTVFFAGIPGGMCPGGGSIPFDTLRIDSTNGNIYKYSYQGCSYLNHEITLDSLKAKLNDNIFIGCGMDAWYTCTDTSFHEIFGQSRQVKAFNHAQDPEFYWNRRYSKGIGQSQYGAPAVYGNSNATLIGCVINGILYGDTTLYYTISGQVRYSDNNQPVNGGYVKALKYDWNLDKVITIDSARISTNGYYSLPHCPQDSLDIMAYSDDEIQDFVPTYYDSTIYWQNSITLYPTSNINNVNIKVHRIVQQPERSYNFVSGGVYKAMMIPNDALKDAMVYAKFNSGFASWSSSIANGYYIVDSLPSGKYEIIADRMGYYSDYRSLSVGEILLDTINFFLTRVVGMTQVSSSLPTSFMLFQNYPNPFNPLTTLNFDVPPMHKNPPAHPGGKGVLVKLVIYDILGREVATLVNEELSAGSYRIVWDASNYASGLYFYKLITDEFMQTRKMVLIK